MTTSTDEHNPVTHTCIEMDWCRCSSMGLEPNEDCPVHGSGGWPPRCAYCGRFMRRSQR